MATLANPFVVDEIGKYITEDAVRDQPNRTSTHYIVVHHAAAFYSPGTACAKIFQFHSSKWPKYGRIGYTEVIQLERDNTICCHLVNPPDLQGAGVAGRNDECYHICAATMFTAIPADEWVEALAQRCAAALKHYPDARIVGHKDIALKGFETACPGQLWATWKPRLIKRVGEILTPPPVVRRFRFAGWPIYQVPGLTGTLAGYVQSTEEIDVDKVYANGAGHLKDQRGFIDLNLDALQEI